MFDLLRTLHMSVKARLLRFFRGREVVKAFRVMHAQELTQTPIQNWPMMKARQAQEIRLVKAGQLQIVDRKSWAFPYLPSSVQRLSMPVAKSCFSDDTEILTKRGWISVTQMKKTDLFASISPDGDFSWEKSIRIIKRRWQGPMLHFDNKGVDILVSPDHRMYGRPVLPVKSARSALGLTTKAQYGATGFTYARDIKWFERRSNSYGFQIPIAASGWKGTLPDSGGIIHLKVKDDGGLGAPAKDYAVRLDDYVALLGIWLAEGTASGSMYGVDHDDPTPLHEQALTAEASGKKTEWTARLGEGHQIQISQTKVIGCARIEELLARMPFRWHRHSSAYVCTSRALWESFAPLGNKYTKRIPGWVKELPSEYLRILVDWMVLGDGHVRKDQPARPRQVDGLQTKFSYGTVSKQLADDLVEVLQKIGIGSYEYRPKPANKRPDGRPPKHLDAPFYSIQAAAQKWNGLATPKEVEYDGYIYCPAVPKYGTVLVRRNGKVAWCGQTPYNLRRFSRTPVARAALNLIKNSIIAQTWDIRPIDGTTTDDPEEQQQRIKIAKKVFKHPNNVDSHQTWLEMGVEDLCIMGAFGSELRLTIDPERPIKMWAMDASCVPGDTEVLTKRGWIRWDTVKDDDVFATRSPLTQRFEWQRAYEVIRKPFKGDLVKFSNNSTDFLVTPNHRMYGSYAYRSWRKRGDALYTYDAPCFESAADVCKRLASGTQRNARGLKAVNFCVPLTANWDGALSTERFELTSRKEVRADIPGQGRKRVVRVRQHSFDWKDWAAFLGIWIAEGSVTGTLAAAKKRAKLENISVRDAALSCADDGTALSEQVLYASRINQHYITISQSWTANREKCGQIECLLDRMGLSWRYEGSSFILSDRLLWEELRVLGNKYTKQVPEYIKNAPSEVIKTFIDWAVMGDGSVRDGIASYTTASRRLADDMSELWLKVGRATNETDVAAGTTTIRGVTYKSAPHYVLTEIAADSMHLCPDRHSNKSAARIADSVPMDGMVYCASVPNEVLYMRRDGRPYWIGNTIRIFVSWSESTPDLPHYAQMTGLQGERGAILFYDDELMYIKDNPATDNPFGLGKLEVAFQQLNDLLGVQRMAGMAGADQVHKCFPGTTEVLTRRGWIPWSDVRDDEEFATRSADGRLQWQHALGFVREWHSGDMIRFNNRELNITVTPNHRMYGQKIYKKGGRRVYDPMGFTQAVDLYNAVTERPGKGWQKKGGKPAKTLYDFRIPMRSAWEDGVLPTRAAKCRIGDCYFDWKDWAAFLGIWMAEGSILRRKTKLPEYRVQIAQSRKSNRRKYKQIDGLLKRMGFVYQAKADRFIFCDRAVWEYLYQFGDSYDKFVPQWIKDAPVEIIRVFFDWAMLGDGSRRKNGRRCYYTASKRMADDMQQLFQQIGTNAAVQQNARERDRIYIVDEMVRAEISIVPEGGRGKDRKPQRIPYNDMVYCAMVPNGTLYCRENGHAFWSGNTWLWWEQPQTDAAYQIVRRHIQNELEGQAKVSIIGGMKKPDVLEVNPVQEADLLLNWQEMLIRMVANAFDMSPMRLGVQHDVNKAVGSVLNDQDFRSAVVPMAKRLQEAFTRKILHDKLGWYDLEYAFLQLDDPDIETKTDMNARMYSANALTPNEWRKSVGKQPLDSAFADLTQFEAMMLNQELMAQLQDQQQQNSFNRTQQAQQQQTAQQQQHEKEMAKQGFAPGGFQPGGGGGFPGGGGGKPISQGEIARGGQIESPKPLALPKFPISGSKWNARQIARMPVNDLADRIDGGQLPPAKKLLVDMQNQEPNVLEQMTEEVKTYFKYVLKEEQGDDDDEKIDDATLQKWMKELRKKVKKDSSRSDNMTDYLTEINQKWKLATPVKPQAKVYRAVKNPGKPGTPPAARAL